MTTQEIIEETVQPNELKLVAAEDKKSLRDRLVRIEGQLRGVQKVIRERIRRRNALFTQV